MNESIRSTFDSVRAAIEDTEERRALDEHRRLMALHVEINTRGVICSLLREFIDKDGTDFDKDETATDRFLGALAGMTDSEGEWEPEDDPDLEDLSHEDEIGQRLEILDTADELLDAAGISEEDCDAMLIEGNQAAGMRVLSALRDTFADDSKALDEFFEEFTFEPLLPDDGADDEASFDAVSRAGGAAKRRGAAKPRFMARKKMPALKGKTWARRFKGRITHNSKHGKANKVAHLAKHKPWTKRMSSKQKVALNKARARAHTSAATALNIKSNKRTRKLGGRRVA